jgi:hypothetical protein
MYGDGSNTKTFMLRFTKDELKQKMDQVQLRYKKELKEINHKWRTIKHYSEERHERITFLAKKSCYICKVDFENCSC